MTEPRPVTASRRIRTALAAGLGHALVRALGVTWRMRVEGPDVFSEARRLGGFVLVLWHGELLPLMWYHRGRGILPMISTHGDGEVIARVIALLGYAPIRGSSSRGGARALLAAVREIREGAVVVITTDGPRGPRRVSAPGAGMAAAKAGAAVVAMGCTVDRAWRLRSWDRFVVPKPFARITVRYSGVARAQGSGPADGEAMVPAISAALMAVCEPDPA